MNVLILGLWPMLMILLPPVCYWWTVSSAPAVFISNTAQLSLWLWNWIIFFSVHLTNPSPPPPLQDTLQQLIVMPLPNILCIAKDPISGNTPTHHTHTYTPTTDKWCLHVSTASLSVLHTCISMWSIAKNSLMTIHYIYSMLLTSRLGGYQPMYELWCCGIFELVHCWNGC